MTADRSRLSVASTGLFLVLGSIAVFAIYLTSVAVLQHVRNPAVDKILFRLLQYRGYVMLAVSMLAIVGHALCTPAPVGILSKLVVFAAILLEMPLLIAQLAPVWQLDLPVEFDLFMRENAVYLFAGAHVLFVLYLRAITVRLGRDGLAVGAIVVICLGVAYWLFMTALSRGWIKLGFDVQTQLIVVVVSGGVVLMGYGRLLTFVRRAVRQHVSQAYNPS